MLEISSIARGYLIEDAMLKAAAVELIVARSICSGKFMVTVAGDVAAVEASVRAGVAASAATVIEELVIPNVHPAVFPALAGTAELPPGELGALGILETFTVASAIEAADAAAKAAGVRLFRIHAAMAIGGKGFLLLTGTVAAVNAAIDAARAAAAHRGMVVGHVVIANPRRELFGEYI
jgi:microcompartment protein CcmL/EutN